MSVGARIRDELRELACLTIHGDARNPQQRESSAGAPSVPGHPPERNQHPANPTNPRTEKSPPRGSPAASRAPAVQEGHVEIHNPRQPAVRPAQFSTRDPMRQPHRQLVILDILASCSHAIMEVAGRQGRAFSPGHLIESDFSVHKKVHHFIICASFKKKDLFWTQGAYKQQTLTCPSAIVKHAGRHPGPWNPVQVQGIRPHGAFLYFGHFPSRASLTCAIRSYWFPHKHIP
jgi:hypothetical protein